MSKKIKQILDQRYQNRMPRLGARVTSRPLDENGRGTGYVMCNVAGTANVRVYTGPNEVYYPGDTVLVEQRGTPATAFYVMLGWEGGPRPDAGALEFTSTTAIGDDTYGAGDLLWGNPYAAHFHLDYDLGQINLKVGTKITGQIDAGTGTFIAGDPATLHGVFAPTGIEFKNGAETLSGWDAVGSTIYGIQTLGRPHGPGIQQREIVDPDTGEIRFAWQILGLNGVPGVSFVTGSDDDPDDYKFYIGPQGSTERLVYEDGNLTITGAFTATSLVVGATTPDFGGQRIINVGDATQDTDGLNRQTGDARYVYQSGSMAGATSQAQTFNYGLIVNETSNDSDTRIEGNGDAYLVFADAGLDAVGIGASAPGAKLHVEQGSSTGSKPALTLHQGDVGWEFMRFIGTSASGENAQSLLVSASLPVAGSLVGWLKIYVQDDSSSSPLTTSSYVMPFYTAPTSS